MTIKSTSANFVAIAEMLALMNTRSVSAKEIVQHTGLSLTTVYRYLQVLHNRKLIVIDDWKRSGGGSQYPCFSWNAEDLTDVPKPEIELKHPADKLYLQGKSRQISSRYDRDTKTFKPYKF